MEQNKINDIKKALEVCANSNIGCDTCPYVGSCSSKLSEDTLELIAHYESEIERISDLVLETIESSNSWMEEACRLANVKKNLENLLSQAYDRIKELDGIGECEFPDTIDRRWEPQKKFAPNFGVNVIVEYQCSECGHFETHQTNYCPQCGCKLKKYEGKEMKVYG